MAYRAHGIIVVETCLEVLMSTTNERANPQLCGRHVSFEKVYARCNAGVVAEQY